MGSSGWWTGGRSHRWPGKASEYARVYSRSQPTGSNLLVNAGFESGVLGPWTGSAPGGANDAGGYVESNSSTYYNGGNPNFGPLIIGDGSVLTVTDVADSAAKFYRVARTEGP